MTKSITTTKDNQKGKVLVLGTIIGALIGLGAAYLILQRTDENGELNFGSREGVKLGVSVFSFFRQLTQLGE